MDRRLTLGVLGREASVDGDSRLPGFLDLLDVAEVFGSDVVEAVHLLAVGRALGRGASQTGSL
jgi:hypothetical protein